MRTVASTVSLALGTLALAGAAPASAQADQLDPQAVSAAARYALPLAFGAFVGRCYEELDPDGYALSNADRLRAKFSEGQDDAWPTAKQALIQMGGEDNEEMAAVFETMSDEQLRPFVDALVGSMVGQEIKAEQCSDIERGLEIIDPLPAENIAELVGFVVELGSRDDEEEAEEDYTK